MNPTKISQAVDMETKAMAYQNLFLFFCSSLMTNGASKVCVSLAVANCDIHSATSAGSKLVDQ